MDGTLSETLRGIGITGKPGKVGAPAYAVNRVPRRETRLGPRPGLSDGRTPASRHSSSGTSGLSARFQVYSRTHDSTKSDTHATISAGCHPSSACRKKRKRVDSSGRPVSKGTGMVDSRSTLANRGSIPKHSHSGNSVHRRFHHGVGSSVPGKDVERSMAEAQS